MTEHTYIGYLKDLEHTVSEPIEYTMRVGENRIGMNEWIGRTISFQITGKKACMACGRKVKKLYQSGYCFPCVTTLAECDLCIVKPHECHYHLGTCRDSSFGDTHCMIPHYVYLAFSSAVKVGLTRKGRQFTRWVDQGATQAVLLAELPTRKQAGELEMEIAKHLPDKTDWRKMLKEEDNGENVDLLALREEITTYLGEAFKPFVISGEQVVHKFVYPRTEDFTPKLSSLSFDKIPETSGVLRGMKGQYLLFDEFVLNVKKHVGYEVHVSVS